MIAVDTNVVVRLLVNDDAVQARSAKALFERNQVFIAPTVLLETEWVLRAAYGLPPAQIHRLLLAVLGLPGAATESPERVALAIDAFGKGLDFADALHLFTSPEAEAFYSFDVRFRQRVARLVPGRAVAAP